MASTEPNPGGEKRYTVSIGGHSLGVFVQRPVSTPATEGTIAFLDGVTEKGNPGREVATFRNGEWFGGKTGRSKLRIRPRIWTVWDDRESAGG